MHADEAFGCAVAAASAVIEIDEVLLASTACGADLVGLRHDAPFDLEILSRVSMTRSMGSSAAYASFREIRPRARGCGRRP